jgi:CHAT domain-containing protein
MENEPDLKNLLNEKQSFDFETDLADYRQDYDELIAYRGLSPRSNRSWLNQSITEASIAECLSSFYGKAPLGLLTYFYDSGELKIWFFNYEGIRFRGASPVTEEHFAELAAQLSRALEIEKHERQRKAYKRGLASLSQRQPREAVELYEVIRRLSRLLFPAGLSQSLLEHQIEHLIIIPALGMQQLPFYLLKPFDDNTQLIDKWSFSLSAGIYDIAKLILRKQVHSSGAIYYQVDEKDLFVGNPLYKTDGDWHLPSLPGAEEEVKNLTADLSVSRDQILLGADATLAAIKAKSQSAGLLYFATHGIADPDDPLDGSGLFLTPSEEDPNGFWTAREIQSDKFSAMLVVLSACQTGLGQSQDAGVVGLSRAFHLAGAENIIMSLWSVDDEATNSLMQIFMRKIQQSNKFFPSEPLRQAILEYRKQYPQAGPLHWAAFSNFGIPY